MRQRARSLGVALGLMLAVAPAALLAHGDRPHAASAPARVAGDVKFSVADVKLLDQQGTPVRLVSDVFGDRVVVINFVFTTCTTVCPVSTATFVQLQERLGARVGRDVALVSLSVDPARDTPARLREYADKHGVRTGWTWLTGRKGDVDAVAKAFGAYTPNPEDHSAVVMVGDPRARTWTRFFGFPGVDELDQRVGQLLAARTRTGRSL